jgi:hypothetical protein
MESLPKEPVVVIMLDEYKSLKPVLLSNERCCKEQAVFVVRVKHCERFCACTEKLYHLNHDMHHNTALRNTG